MEFNYKTSVTLEQRKKDFSRVIGANPDRIPIICEKCPGSKAPEIIKKKYLVPPEMKIGQFGEIIRRKMELGKESALFFLVNGKISLSGNQTINEIYEKYKDPEDSFLYIGYSNEMVWG